MPSLRTRALALLGLEDSAAGKPEQQRVAAVSKAFLTVIIVFVFLHVALVGVVGHNRSTGLFSAALVGCALLLVARALIDRGWIRTGTWLGVAAAVSVGLFAGWFAAFIGVAQAAWVFVGVSYCTLVLGFRAGMLATGLALAAYALLAYTLEAGAVRAQMVPHPFNQWLNLFTPSMVLLVSMGVIREALLESVRRQLRTAESSAELLERTVRERTAALQTAVQDLQTLSYLLSHDLSGKVDVIRTFSGVIGEKEGERLTPEGQRRLGRIEENARQLQGMIDGLLAYSRTAALQPSLQSVAVDRLLASIAADLQQRHPQARIEWQVGDVKADPVMLRHVLQNLVDNACKHAGRDDPHVRIVAERRAGECVICVGDNGAGFDPEDTERLFELFEQGNGGPRPGHGVGLGIVKYLVERLGGRVWAETTPAGARFYFTVAGS